MRAVCHAAAAPADRRLFEAGWPGHGAVRGVPALTCAGLEVGRHIEEQF